MATHNKQVAIVVDDQQYQADLLAENLRSAGLEAYAFRKWSDAKERLTRGMVDLLVVDQVLGHDGLGIELMAELLDAGQLEATKMVILTGSADRLSPEHQELAKKWGIQIESKPLHADLIKRWQQPHLPRPLNLFSRLTPILQHFKLPQGVAPLSLLLLAVAVVAVVAWLWFSNRSSENTPRQAFVSIRVAVNPVPLGTLAIIAAKNGYWKNEGLDVQLISFPSGKLSLDAVLAGSAEFATAAETPIMRAGLAGHAPLVLATIASSPDDCKVVYRRDHGIARPADLKGKSVATAFGTSAEYFMDAFLRHHKIARSEVTSVNLKPAEMVGAFARGDIAAFFIWEPYPLSAQKLIANSAVFSGADVYTETFQIVARQDYAQSHPEVVKKLLRGLINAERHTVAQKQDAAASVSAYTQIPADDVSAIWANFQFRVHLDANFVKLLESQADWARSQDSTLPRRVNFHALVWRDPLMEIDSSRVQ